MQFILFVDHAVYTICGPCSLYYVIVIAAGMSGSEVLHRVDKGYRMPKPTGPIAYTDSYYDTMLKCWNRKPEDRPTFSYLHDMFDDYFVATEPDYRDTEDM